MRLHFVDNNPAVIEGLRKAFVDCNEVTIKEGSIFDYASCTVVSPANSYGFMDGGIDKEYIRFFGLTPQDSLRKIIAQTDEGYLPIGSAIIVKTGNNDIPNMICAPTMIGPEVVRKENAFFAMAAILNISENKQYITDIYCPGLCTGVGGVSGQDAAEEMANAYRKWKIKNNGMN